MPADAAFAIPGDLTQKTGGYIYEHRLLAGLRALGHDIRHIALSGTFPTPDAAAMDEAVRAMREVPADRPLIVDGLIFGAVDPAGLRSVRAPVIAMLHHPLGLETGLPPALARHLIAVETQNLVRAERIVCTSPHTARLLTDRFGADAGRIAIALPGFEPVATVRQPRAEPPLILSVGLLAERKGHAVLLAALARLADLPWQAVIVGKTHDPAVAQSLHRQRDVLGLGARVRFAGLVDDADLARLYGRATVFALASRYEGYGMAFAEALRHGVPVVGCDTGAVPDTVPVGTGLLGPVDDVEAFSHNLRRLLTDGALHAAMAHRATAYGQTLPDVDMPARLMSAIIDDLAGAAGPGSAAGSPPRAGDA